MSEKHATVDPGALHPRTVAARYASRTDLVVGAIAILVALVLPHLLGFKGTVLNTVLYIGVYTVLALGLNVVVGFTGLLDLGYVVFFATGAVVTGFLLSLTRTADGTIDWGIGTSAQVDGTQLLSAGGTIIPIILLAGLLCAALGVLRGLPTLRVRGDYYAIVTLGIAEIFFETSLWDESNAVNATRVTGGAFGVKLPSTYAPKLFGEALHWNSAGTYYLIMACVVLAVIATHHLNRSRVGRALAAVRLDETAARACGVNVARSKLTAFAVSGFIGGVGGALFVVWKDGSFSIKNLDVWQSILILCGVVLGGMGSIRGTIVGMTVLLAIDQALRQDWGGFTAPAEALNLIYGLLLVVVMRFRPGGLLPPLRRGRVLSDGERADLKTGRSPLCSLEEHAS